MALKLLWIPHLEAYTAVGNKPEGYLPDSLFNNLKVSVWHANTLGYHLTH